MLDDSQIKQADGVSNDQGNQKSRASISIHRENQIRPSVSPGSVCPFVVGIKHDIVVVKLRPVEFCPHYRFFRRVFTTLEKWQLPVDMFSTSQARITLALGAAALQALDNSSSASPDSMSLDLMHRIQQLLPDDHVELFPRMAIISAVGHSGRRMARLAGHIFATMDTNNIPTVMMSHDATELGIACAVAEQYTAKTFCIFEECLFDTL